MYSALIFRSLLFRRKVENVCSFTSGMINCTLILFVISFSVLRNVVWIERRNAQTGKQSDLLFFTVEYCRCLICCVSRTTHPHLDFIKPLGISSEFQR
jgi:hypothetical protein